LIMFLDNNQSHLIIYQDWRWNVSSWLWDSRWISHLPFLRSTSRWVSSSLVLLAWSFLVVVIAFFSKFHVEKRFKLCHSVVCFRLSGWKKILRIDMNGSYTFLYIIEIEMNCCCCCYFT
jgi:hypothetical protein